MTFQEEAWKAKNSPKEDEEEKLLGTSHNLLTSQKYP